MTDWPEAVREYEAFKKSGEEPGWDEEWPYTALEKADAAIAALKAVVAAKDVAIEGAKAAIIDLSERAEKAEAENEKLRNKQAFNGDWERMYCATGHERISYIGENCPLCAAKAEVEECDFQRFTQDDKDRIAFLERTNDELRAALGRAGSEWMCCTRHGTTVLTLEDRCLLCEAEDALAKVESQKHGLATAAKTGMVAGNRVIELEAEVKRLKCCGSCGYLFDDCGQGLCGWANPSPTQVGSPHVNFADPCFRAPSRWKRRES